MDLSSPSQGLVSKHHDHHIARQMSGTIYPFQIQFTTPTPPPPPPPPPSLSSVQPPHTQPPQHPQTDELIDELGITTDSNITPAMYNLWQSFASIFLPQSLALPPSLHPLSLLPCAHIASQLRPFDLILIRTPGMFYGGMRRVVEHQYDHVAIVLTQHCALHISPPFTRIIPVSTLLMPIRDPVILRPKLNPEYQSSKPVNPLQHHQMKLNPKDRSSSPFASLPTSDPLSISSTRLMDIYSAIRSDPNIAHMVREGLAGSNAQLDSRLTTARSKNKSAATNSLKSSSSSLITPDQSQQSHIKIHSHPFFTSLKGAGQNQVGAVTPPTKAVQNGANLSHSISQTPTQFVLTRSDLDQYRLFLELISLLGTPYDSLKMYSLWGKLALNRVTNQPLTKIDSTGVICTDAIFNILTKFDFFILHSVSKQWKLLSSHAKYQFNLKSNHAIAMSKVITLEERIDDAQTPRWNHQSNNSSSRHLGQNEPPFYLTNHHNGITDTQILPSTSDHQLHHPHHFFKGTDYITTSNNATLNTETDQQQEQTQLHIPDGISNRQIAPLTTTANRTTPCPQTSHITDQDINPTPFHLRTHSPIPYSFTSIPQQTIYHQLPISNLEGLDHHRLSAYSLNDLLQLSHVHYIDPDPRVFTNLSKLKGDLFLRGTPTTTTTPQPSQFSSQNNQNSLTSTVQPTTLPTPSISTTTFVPSQFSLTKKGFSSTGNQALFEGLSEGSGVNSINLLSSTPNHTQTQTRSPLIYQSQSNSPISPTSIPTAIRDSKQFNELIREPLWIDSAFEVIKPGSPVPIHLIHNFCNQLTILCANFVLRETTLGKTTQLRDDHDVPATIVTIDSGISGSSADGSQFQTDLITAPNNPYQSPLITKYNRHELLGLVNPYYRFTNPQKQHSIGSNSTTTSTSPTQSEEPDPTSTLADSLYYHLLCKLPGMIPFFILQALKVGMESLQTGKKYELRPEVLLFSPQSSHHGLVTLERHVNEMYRELVLEPWWGYQNGGPSGNRLGLNHNTIENTAHNISDKSNIEDVEVDNSKIRLNETIGQKLQNTISDLQNFVKTTLFNSKYASTTNPDGLDPKIQSRLDQYDLKNDSEQHVIIQNGPEKKTLQQNNNTLPPQHPEAISQFPAWLEAILPLDLLSKVKELVNIMISPQDGYVELATNPNDLNSIRQGKTDTLKAHPFPSIKYLSSIPAPFLLYIWSLLKPIVRFYLLLTILSRFLPYIVYRLTATALTTILALPSNTVGWLLSSGNGTSPAHPDPIGKQHYLKRFFKSSSTTQVVPKQRGMVSKLFPRPNLIGAFRRRFIGFVSAIVVASIIRSVWNANSENVKSAVVHTAQHRLPTGLRGGYRGPNGNSTNIMSMGQGVGQANTRRAPGTKVSKYFQGQQNNDQYIPLPTPQIPHHIDDDALLALAPSSLLQQYNPTTNQHQPKQTKPTPSDSLNIKQQPHSPSPMATTGLFITRMIQGYQKWILGQTDTPTTSSSSPTQSTNPAFFQFLTQTDQSLAWLNDVFRATVYVTTDTLGLRTLGKNLSQSRSVKEIKKQIGYVAEQWGKARGQ